MLVMLGLLCWEWPLVSLKGLLMLMMPALLCWVGTCLPGKAADAHFAGLVVLDVAVCIFRITADAHHDSGLVVLGVAV